MNLADRLATNSFIISVELRPPKSVELRPLLEVADRVRGRVDSFIVPENPGGIMSMCPTVLARRLVEAGHESMVVLTCRDRNRLAFQSTVLGLAADGIQTIVVARGTDPAYGDHPRAVAVHDLSTHEALAAIRSLSGGRDLTGSSVAPPPDLYSGAEINPFVKKEELSAEVGEAEKRVGAGAKFLVTPAVHDTERFAEAIDPFLGFGLPIMVRIMLLKSVGMARYLNRNVAGDLVPSETIKRLRKAPDKGEAALQIAVELARKVGNHCHGVCFQPLGWEERIPALIELLQMRG